MRILGIEFGSWSVKAVEMESRFRRFDVLELHEVRLPLTIVDPTDIYRKAVDELMDRLPSHPEKIVASLLPAQTSVRVLNLPVRQIKKAEQMFRFEIEDSTPFRLEEAITEHQSIRIKDGCSVFTAISPKRHIQSQVEWLKAIGADSDWLTFDGMGMINLFLSTQTIVEGVGPLMVLDVGHQKTNLVIIDEGRVAYFRSIPWGGFQITQGISSTLGISLENAEILKHDQLNMNQEINTTSEARELFSCGAVAMANFLADLNHTLYAYRTQFKRDVQNTFLCGGTSLTKGIEIYIGKQLDRPTQILTPSIVQKHKESTSDIETTRFGEAYGRALEFGHKAPVLFNFRRGDFSKTTSLNDVSTIFKNPSTRLFITYACLFIGALFIYANIAKIIASKDVVKSLEELKKTMAETIKNVPAKQRATLSSNPEELKKYIEQKNKVLEDRLKMIGRSSPPMLALINSISESFANDVKVDVNTLVIDDRSLVIEGVLYQGSLDVSTKSLQKNPYFSGVGVTMNGQRFTYRGSVKGR